MRYDAAVIGSGPAGLEAAVNLQIRKKRFLFFGQKNFSSKIELAPRIDNYLGLPGISGKELQRRFLDHISAAEIELRREQVSSVYPMGDYFALATNKDTYEADTVIIASGTVSGMPFPGEERLLGRGVGYCATCDAPLYKGKTVVVLGYNDEAVHEANFVSEIAEKVWYIPMTEHKTPLAESVEIVRDTVVEITGEDKVAALVLRTRAIKTDGVFILRESLSPTALLPGIEMKDGYIAVDSDMRTNIPGCFAAGDCTGKPHQYMRAAGQGQTAALNAAAYIDVRKTKQKG